MSLLTLSGISKLQEGGFSVKDISFDQPYLQKIAIVGETGSGKTTLLKMIAGLIQPDFGEIRFRKERVLGPNEQLIPGRKEIAYLSQNFELRNNYWVREVLEYANELSQEEANNLYAVCRIQHLLGRKTDQLSGGEKQRIALARLLSTTPQVLLLDEPFSNLDWGHKNIIQSVIHDIGTKLNITCVLVSHDASDVLSWADIILIMKDGQIIQQGPPEEVYLKPINVYCAELFGAYNLIDTTETSAVTFKNDKTGSGKKVLIRPEHIHLVSPTDNAIRGIVQRISFRGNYYMVEVLVGIQLINVQVYNKNYKAGDEVNLWISEDDVNSVET